MMPRIVRALILAAGMSGAAAHAEIHDVDLRDNFFSPAQLTIAPGDTVRWTNRGLNAHNVISDNDLFSSGAPSAAMWTFEFTFDTPGSYPYYCSVHGAPGGIGMAGTITVEGFTINEGLNGAWYEPATSGQGFLLDIDAELAIFSFAWFTWTDTPGVHDWFVGNGSFSGNSVETTLFRQSGGIFDDPTDVTQEEAGSVSFTFQDCTTGTATYTIDDTDPPRTGEIPLTKLLPASSLCTGGGDSGSEPEDPYRPP